MCYSRISLSQGLVRSQFRNDHRLLDHRYYSLSIYQYDKLNQYTDSKDLAKIRVQSKHHKLHYSHHKSNNFQLCKKDLSRKLFDLSLTWNHLRIIHIIANPQTIHKSGSWVIYKYCSDTSQLPDWTQSRWSICHKRRFPASCSLHSLWQDKLYSNIGLR